jgi:hypothetical protein
MKYSGSTTGPQGITRMPIIILVSLYNKISILWKSYKIKYIFDVIMIE